MKKILISFLFVAVCQAVSAQSDSDLKIASEFKISSNNSLFLRTYSVKPSGIFEIEMPLGGELSEDGAKVFNLNPNQVYGPIETDSFFVWVKAIEVDSLYKMRVGNIFIDPKLTSPKKAKAIADNVLNQLNKGASFDAMCKKYKNDSNENFECDLGWFFQGQMVKEFDNEILKHKKGDYFIVQTEFGYHVVKLLDNTVKDRFRIKAVQLVRNK